MSKKLEQPQKMLAAYLRDSGGSEQELSLAQQEAEIRAWFPIGTYNPD